MFNSDIDVKFKCFLVKNLVVWLACTFVIMVNCAPRTVMGIPENIVNEQSKLAIYPEIIFSTDEFYLPEQIYTNGLGGVAGSIAFKSTRGLSEEMKEGSGATLNRRSRELLRNMLKDNIDKHIVNSPELKPLFVDFSSEASIGIVFEILSYGLEEVVTFSKIHEKFSVVMNVHLVKSPPFTAHADSTGFVVKDNAAHSILWSTGPISLDKSELKQIEGRSGMFGGVKGMRSAIEEIIEDPLMYERAINQASEILVNKVTSILKGGIVHVSKT